MRNFSLGRDMNFLATPSGGVNVIPFTSNLIAFLGAPVPVGNIPPAQSVPALSDWALSFLMLLLCCAAYAAPRRQHA
jgi:IPTL-CTERM motif